MNMCLVKKRFKNAAVSKGISGYLRVSQGISGYLRVSQGISGYLRVSQGILFYFLSMDCST